MIKLSFIVPFYGVEPYIGQCLKSLYDQDLPESEYEVVCVNDCSPDDSEQIVLDYQNAHSNLVLVRHEVNKKLGAARNSGLKVAKGKYVWFVDSDDYIKKDCLKGLLDYCERNEVDLLHWSVQDNGGKWLIKVENSDVVTGIEELTSGSRDVTYPWNRIYKRAFLLENNLWFNDLWGGDVIHSIQALNVADRVMNLAECYYFYRTDNMNSDMSSPANANKVISFSYILARAIDDCKTQLSPVLYSLIDEFVAWRVNKSYKPILRMPLKEKRKFYKTLNSDNALKGFVLSVADKKVRFVIQCPLAVYVLHPFYGATRHAVAIVRR